MPDILPRTGERVFGLEQGRDRKRSELLGYVESVLRDHLFSLLEALFRWRMAPEVALQTLDCHLAKLVNRCTGMGHVLPMEFCPKA